MKGNDRIWKRLLIFLVVAHIVINSLWLFINRVPPSWDAASHTTITLDIAQKLRALTFTEIFSSSNYYPIFVHFLAAIGVVFIGPNISAIQSTGTLFFVISLIVVYAYTKSLTGNSRTAFFATAIYSFSPIVFSESRRMMLDVPLTALVLLSVYFLHKSSNFKKLKESLLFFVSVALLLSTKWTGVVFLFIPILFTSIEILRKKTVTHAVKHSLIGIGIILCIAGPWYVANFESLSFLAGVNSTGELGDPTSLLTYGNLIYYFQKIINYITTPAITTLFVVALMYLLVTKGKHKWFLITQLLFGYIFFTFIQNKDARYIMPLVPFIGIVCAVLLNALITKFKSVGTIGVWTIITIFTVQFLILTVRPPVFEGIRKSVYIHGLEWVNLIDVNDSVSKKYDTQVWPAEEIFRDMEMSNDGAVVVTYEGEYFNPSTLSLYMKKRNYYKTVQSNPIITADASYLIRQFSSTTFPDKVSIEKYLLTAQYVLTSPDTTGVQDIKQKDALEQIRNYVESSYACAKFTSAVAPNGTKCFVREGEVLKTGSDIIVDGVQQPSGEKLIEGSVQVDCLWGCSFGVVTASPSNLVYGLVNTYILPTGQRMNLYELRPILHLDFTPGEDLL